MLLLVVAAALVGAAVGIATGGVFAIAVRELDQSKDKIKELW